MIPRPLPLSLRLLAAVSVCLFVVSYAAADPSDGGQSAAEAAKSKAETAEKEKKPSFAELLGDAERIDGLIKLYRKDNKLYAELTSSVMEKDLLVAATIARGIGIFPLVGGLSWIFDEDWVWQFRKVDDNIQIVRRNVRFRAPGSQDYNDSVLYSLPIATMHGKNCVVDLTDVFMSDLVGLGKLFRGRKPTFDAKRSTWAKVKGFKNNVEIEVAATYTGIKLYTVPDAVGGAATIHVHYSVSLLPTKTGYKPRLADDRVGHFVTAIKDFTKPGIREDQFVRYVNRWDLRKVDPSAEVSLPVVPIVFWIEKTVPNKYRLAVRNGIMEWNKAFERAGFAGAIEVRQQPDDAAWDPEDINYNTLRWINSNTTIAVGPSQVNPRTGQILNSDVIVDASFIDYWTRLFEIEKPGLTTERSAAPSSLEDFLGAPRQAPMDLSYDSGAVYDYARGMSQQLAFGAMALAVGDKPATKKEQEEKDKRIKKLLDEGMKALVTHEVGHSLGLRHNFKASAYMTMEEINDPEKTREVGLTASIMDYMPVNIAPKGKKQGDYFSRTIGPYDYWAIEYAYKPAKAAKAAKGDKEGKGDKGDSEEKMLAKIASRCAEPALHYATDEDAENPPRYGSYDSPPDPLVNRFDLGKDPCEFARWRVELIGELLPGLVDQIKEPGKGYQNVRKAFNLLMKEHARAMHFAGRYIGGVYVNRDHEGDPGARSPLVIAEAKKQREALELLEQQVFGPGAYQFPTKLYSFLAAPHWSHWGIRRFGPKPYFPVRDMVLAAQDRVLNQLLSPETLSRVLDSELKTPADADVFTAAELLQGLTAAIFSETEKLQEGKFTNRAPAISSLRRSLQRRYFERLAAVARGKANRAIPLGTKGEIANIYPADSQAVAYEELEALEGRLKQVLAGKAQLDAYSRGHLSELASRIRKVLDAQFYLPLQVQNL